MSDQTPGPECHRYRQDERTKAKHLNEDVGDKSPGGSEDISDRAISRKIQAWIVNGPCGERKSEGCDKTSQKDTQQFDASAQKVFLRSVRYVVEGVGCGCSHGFNEN